MVSEFFLQEQGGAPRTLLEVGDRFTVSDRSTLASQDLQVAGVMTSDFQFNGLLVGRSVVEGLLGARSVPNRAYVAVEPGADPAEVAGAVVWLAWPAGAFVSGQNIVIDGGTLVSD